MNSQTGSADKGDILIVDDKPDNLRLLSAMLQSCGYHVRKAINGQLALQGVQIAPPDLILLDINMPLMNGYEVCQKLKSSAQTCNIPVIFVSALNEVLDKVKAFQVGGVDYITKPFQVEEVLLRIEAQLSQQRLAKQLQEQNAKLQQEITERRRAEQDIRLLLSSAQSLSEAIDFHSALAVTLCHVYTTIGWDFGEAWIPNSDNTVLECSRGWCARDPNLEIFRSRSEAYTFAPNISLPGRVWVTKQPEWITDISVEPAHIFLRAQIALEAGLKTSLAVPILFHDQVVAILIFFKKVKREPEERLIKLVNAVAAQLGSLMQRIKVEAALVEANHKLERLATLDGLTGVANRRRFDECLTREWRRLFREQLPLSLILCDVDYFKRYNDTYGHQAGDDCLRQVATKISQCVKRPADLVARYGGEEFAIILPNTEAEGAVWIAEEIRQAVEQLNILHSQSGVSKYVTLSVGVTTMIPHLKVDMNTLIAQGDRALYCAKEQGRNQTVVKNFISNTNSP